MKVAICILSYGRHDLTAQVLAHNLNCTGLLPGEYGLFVADMEGISKASNTMLRRAYQLGYTHFMICGNDIQEPQDWLKLRLDFLRDNPHAGMVSIPVDGMRHRNSAEMVIANFMISREVVDAVGAFDERLDPYGAIDLDYNKRCTAAGYINYYLGGVVAIHLHNHDGTELYGFNKAEKVNATWHLHAGPLERVHIPLIEQQQFYGEA